MSKSRAIIFLTLVLIIAGGLRLYHLDRLPPGLYPDEAMNGNNATEAISTGDYKIFYPENNGREGLFINIQAAFIQLLGGGKPWVLRLPSALIGILTVLGMYFLGRELFSKRVGLLASFFLATSFWHINFSRIGFRAIMAPLLLVWAIYFFLHAIRRHSDQKNFPALFYAGLAGLIYGLGFYSYIAYRATPLIFLAFIPFFGRHKGFWKATAVFVLFAIIVALPIGIYFINHPADFFGRTTQVSVFNSLSPTKDLAENLGKTFAMFNFAGDGNWRHNFSGRPELFWPVGILLWVGTILTINAVRKKFHHGDDHGYAIPSTLIFSWLIFAGLPVVVSNEGLPHALRSILLLPPVLLLAAWGGTYLYDKIQKMLSQSANAKKTKLVFAMFAWITIALLALEAYTTYFFLWGKNKNVRDAFATNQVELAEEIESLPSSTPKYIMVKADGVDVRGIPMPAQTLMFLTDTFLPERQVAKNIHYVLPKDSNTIQKDASVFEIK